MARHSCIPEADRAANCSLRSLGQRGEDIFNAKKVIDLTRIKYMKELHLHLKCANAQSNKDHTVLVPTRPWPARAPRAGGGPVLALRARREIF